MTEPAHVADPSPRSGSQPECDNVIDHIETTNENAFTALPEQLRENTLQSIAQCLGSLPEDSRSQQKWLTKIWALDLSQTALAEAGLQRTLRHLKSKADTATANLAKQILSGQQAQPDSARYT